MRFTSALVLAAAAGLAAAQTKTNAAPTQSATSSSCDAQNILDTCKAGIQSQIDACTGNDYMCLCDNYTNLLTCYNNCPNDPVKSSVQNQVTQYCLAASPLSASSISAAKTAIQGASSTAAPPTTSAAASASAASASASSSSVNNGAGEVVAPVGGVLALLLGVAGLL